MLVQDHELKRNLLDLLQHMCNSGPEGWKTRLCGAQCSAWLWARGSSRCFCELLAGFGPAAPSGAAGAQNGCEA